MSQGDNTPLRTLGQPENVDKCAFVNNHDRCCSVWADIGEIILRAISSPITQSIGRRLGLLAGAAFIPSAGQGNTAAVAFCLNLTESGAKALARRRNIPVAKPGDERVYRFANITGTFAAPESKKTPDSEAPVKLKRIRRSKKTR
ncbi:MAG: hypothetical protein V4719_00720 [Planctomycetota bacterium]